METGGNRKPGNRETRKPRGKGGGESPRGGEPLGALEEQSFSSHTSALRMQNPFSAVLEKTAPTPKKGSDENSLQILNIDEPQDESGTGVDLGSSKSPAFIKSCEVGTPQSHRKVRSNSVLKMASPAPQIASVGRTRSASNREMTTTPLKSSISATPPHKQRNGIKSAQKSIKNVGAGAGVRTPGVHRVRSVSAMENTTPSNSRKACGKSTLGNLVASKPTVKMLDRALRESLSGYKEAVEGKSEKELAQLEDAEKRRRESMYRLRQRKSIDESMIQSKANCQEKIESLNLQNGFENAIENAARRQSTVVLNEFKQLVEAANSEVMGES